MSDLSCNLGDLFPDYKAQFGIFPKLDEQFIESMNVVFSRIVTTLNQIKMSTIAETTLAIQKQMLGFIPKSDNDSYSRLYLRSLFNLPPMYKEDSTSIKTLEGSLSWISNKKINITESIREMRDWE